MIVIKAIEVNGVLTPEILPNTKFGSHCDKANFYFFETLDEANTFKDLITYNEEIIFNFETQKFEVR